MAERRGSDSERRDGREPAREGPACCKSRWDGRSRDEPARWPSLADGAGGMRRGGVLTRRGILNELVIPSTPDVPDSSVVVETTPRNF